MCACERVKNAREGTLHISSQYISGTSKVPQTQNNLRGNSQHETAADKTSKGMQPLLNRQKAAPEQTESEGTEMII